MVRHLLIVATGFRLSGLLLAAGAIAALVDLAGTARVMYRTPPPDNNAPLDIGTYGLVGLLSNAARGIGQALHALAGLAVVILVVLVVAAVLALLFGVLLYLTGRGIGHHAMWARIVAMLIGGGLALVSFATIAVLRRDLVPFAAAPEGLSLYTLWVLIWRFG